MRTKYLKNKECLGVGFLLAFGLSNSDHRPIDEDRTEG